MKFGSAFVPTGAKSDPKKQEERFMSPHALRTFKTPCSTPIPPTCGQYYVYSNGPKVSTTVRPKYKEGERPRGVHDYHCMMWDPHIYRGPTFKTFAKAEEERCKRKGDDDNKGRNLLRKKALAKGRSKKGIVRPVTPPHHSSKLGYGDMGIQTDRFLEELTDETIEKDASTQTDKTFDHVVAPLFCPVKLGQDVETQVQPWEMFVFDTEVVAVVDDIISKVIEQSLFELMEEQELENLLKQQRAFEERHRVQLVRLDRLQKREQQITEEKQRLIAQRKKEMAEEREVEQIIGAQSFAGCYLGGLSANGLNDLRRASFMGGNEEVHECLIPWLTEGTKRKLSLQGHSKSILDAIIQSVVEARETEVAAGIWKEIDVAGGPDISRALPSDEDEVDYE